MATYVFETRAELASSSETVLPLYVQVLKYAIDRPIYPASFKKVGSQKPDHNLYVYQSATYIYWELWGPVVSPLMAGARYNYVNSQSQGDDDSDYFNDVFTYVRVVGAQNSVLALTIVFGFAGSGKYFIAKGIDATAIQSEAPIVVDGSGLTLFGSGGRKTFPTDRYIALDMTRSNNLVLSRVHIFGEAIDPPLIGILSARATDDDNVAFNTLTNCSTSGKFAFAGYVNYRAGLNTEIANTWQNDMDDTPSSSSYTNPDYALVAAFDKKSYAAAYITYPIWGIVPTASDTNPPAKVPVQSTYKTIVPPGAAPSGDPEIKGFVASTRDGCSYVKKVGDGHSILLVPFQQIHFSNCYANSRLGIRLLGGTYPISNCCFEIHHEGSKLIHNAAGGLVTSNRHPVQWAVVQSGQKARVSATDDTPIFFDDKVELYSTTIAEPTPLNGALQRLAYYPVAVSDDALRDLIE